MDSAQEIAAARTAATRYRNGLEAALAAGQFAQHPALKTFPRGCCGYVTEFLRQYLRDQGLGMWEYVFAQRTTADGRWGTHAWAERQGVLIDVTGDQFPAEDRPAVYVGPAEGWYEPWEQLSRRRDYTKESLINQRAMDSVLRHLPPT